MSMLPRAAGVIGGCLSIGLASRQFSTAKVVKNEQSSIKKKYHFLHVGYLNEEIRNPQAKKDLEAGRFVRCQPDWNDPKNQFSASVTLTGTTDPEACEQLKEYIMQNIKSAELSLVDAQNEPLSEDYCAEEKEYVVGYCAFDFVQAEWPLKFPAVYRAFNDQNNEKE